MSCFDVFNGDADGLCALHQLRLTYPMSATLVTGVKRDVSLLARVRAQPGDEVAVMDISIDANSAALNHLLNLGVSVLYFDHHAASARPQHRNLHGIIDTSPDVCTSALVDRYVGGEHRAWAVVAAFGDGMPALARRLAEPLRSTDAQLETLRELGELMNYNAYGEEIADLFFHPAELYRRLAPHAQPARFIERESALIARLREARAQDSAHAAALQAKFSTPAGSIYVLDDAPWARRLRGDLAHQLAQRAPSQALALLTPNAAGGYTVSVRAPHARPKGADVLCKQFLSGGGRAAAGGINHLEAHQLDEFARRFYAEFTPLDATN
jgi:hypothetical protein